MAEAESITSSRWLNWFRRRPDQAGRWLCLKFDEPASAFAHVNAARDEHLLRGRRGDTLALLNALLASIFSSAQKDYWCLMRHLAVYPPRNDLFARACETVWPSIVDGTYRGDGSELRDALVEMLRVYFEELKAEAANDAKPIPSAVVTGDHRPTPSAAPIIVEPVGRLEQERAPSGLATCLHCAKALPKRRSARRQYCSTSCRVMACRARAPTKQSKDALPAPSRVQMRELTPAADLPDVIATRLDPAAGVPSGSESRPVEPTLDTAIDAASATPFAPAPGISSATESSRVEALMGPSSSTERPAEGIADADAVPHHDGLAENEIELINWLVDEELMRWRRETK